MAVHIKDERLPKGFTLKFAVGRRRVTLGDPYMKAIQETTVDVHFTRVREVTGKGVVGEDGLEREVDTIVCATGFDISYHPQYPVLGHSGIALRSLHFPTTSCMEVPLKSQFL